VRRRLVVLGIVMATLAAPACSRGGRGSGDGAVTVSAAASLTGAFTRIGRDFEAANDGVTVTFNFGPSDGLANQIQEGAPVDVFAPASPTWMDAVQDDPGVSGRTDFARNRLAIVVPGGNPAAIATLDDLTRSGVKLVLAAEGVPAGDYARQILEHAGISRAALANVVSNEEDVKGVITKVLSGDADAGFAYVTDVTPDVADRVDLVEIPDEQNVIATYPIAVVAGSKQTQLARRFVDFVLGPGRDVLRRFGFLPA
jgi:molybdate transport system substrate-binding protein